MQAPPVLRLSAALLAAVVSLAPAPASADWRQFHSGPARLGVSRDTTLRPANLDRVRILWSKQAGASEEGINSSPVVANGVVYVGSDDGRLYAFGAGHGRLLWSRPVYGRVRSSPSVVGGVVYIGSDEGWFQARRVGDGKLLWQKQLGGRVTAPPLVAEGRVYVGSRSGTFYAFRADTGRVVWERTLWSVWDAAAYRDGTVYVGSDQERVWAFNARTGRKRWMTEVWGRVRSTPAVTGERVYFGTDMGRVYALDRRTGSKLWYAAGTKPGTGFVRCAPAVAEGMVFVSVGMTTTPMDGMVRAFDADTGTLRWTGELADYSTSSPAYANGVIWVGSFDHQLYAFDAGTGIKLWRSGWQYEDGFFDRGISSSPALDTGRVFVGVRDGRLYSLGLPS
jgi:outer membrane protein assembly factor BamB